MERRPFLRDGARIVAGGLLCGSRGRIEAMASGVCRIVRVENVRSF